jgi:hypothetical protein
MQGSQMYINVLLQDMGGTYHIMHDLTLSKGSHVCFAPSFNYPLISLSLFRIELESRGGLLLLDRLIIHWKYGSSFVNAFLPLLLKVPMIFFSTMNCHSFVSNLIYFLKKKKYTWFVFLRSALQTSFQVASLFDMVEALNIFLHFAPFNEIFVGRSKFWLDSLASRMNTTTPEQRLHQKIYLVCIYFLFTQGHSVWLTTKLFILN